MSQEMSQNLSQHTRPAVSAAEACARVRAKVAEASAARCRTRRADVGMASATQKQRNGDTS